MTQSSNEDERNRLKERKEEEEEEEEEEDEEEEEQQEDLASSSGLHPSTHLSFSLSLPENNASSVCNSPCTSPFKQIHALLFRTSYLQFVQCI
jgi:hypothetical protein